MDDSSSPTHCAVCGDRFMGEARAEVTLTEDLSARLRKGDVVVVHADTCFDKNKMEVA